MSLPGCTLLSEVSPSRGCSRPEGPVPGCAKRPRASALMLRRRISRDPPRSAPV